MALPRTTLTKSRNLSRRDHVLNLLPPLSVVNKQDATMHERLFAEDPPRKNYPGNFPSKVLRHLGAWTFYSSPTKGELALLDRSIYDLKNNTKKTDANEKKPSTHNGDDTKKGTQFKYDGVSKKRLETTKGNAVKANQKREIRRKKGDEETSQIEKNKKIQKGKSSLASKSTQNVTYDLNSLQKIKRRFSEDRNHTVESTKKTIKRISSLKRASNKQQQNTKVKDKTIRSQTLVSAVEITLKKSRGKVLGGAKSGTEFANEDLAVKGHYMPVPGRKKVPGKSCRNNEEATRNQKSEKALRDGDQTDRPKLNTDERKDNRSRKPNRVSHHVNMYSARPCDGNKAETVAYEKTTIKEVRRSVIKIPLEENQSPEESEHNLSTPNIEDLDCHNNDDPRKSEKCATDENSCELSEN